MKESFEELVKNGLIITITDRIFKRDSVKYLTIYQLMDLIKGNNEYYPNDYKIGNIIQKIRELNPEDKKEHTLQQGLKYSHLPTFYLSYMTEKADAQHIVSLSSFTAIDIDEYDFRRYEEIMFKLKNSPLVWFIFSTPSSEKRLKVIIKHNLNNLDHYKDFYNELCDNLENYLSLKVDRCCKDKGRGHYLSFDSFLYDGTKDSNKVLQTYNYIHKEKPKKETIRVEENKEDNKRIDLFYYCDSENLNKESTAEELYKYTKHFYKLPKNGSRNDWVFSLSYELMKYIYDSESEEIISLISESMEEEKDFTVEEIRKTFENAKLYYRRKGYIIGSQREKRKREIIKDKKRQMEYKKTH